MPSAFYDAPAAEQTAQLTALAHKSLAAWGHMSATLTLVYDGNNTVFRVISEGQSYALKVHRPDGKTETEIRAEHAWLRHIAHQTDLLAPKPAAPLHTGTLPGIDAPVYVSLYNWIDGEALPVEGYTPAHAEQIGAYAARLHTMPPPTPVAQAAHRPTLDYEGLFGARSPYASQHEPDYITDESQQILDAVAARVRDVMQRLDAQPSNTGFIHGDFIYKNTLLTSQGRVAAIDYDDCGFGYCLYDLACPLLFYKPLPNYDQLKAALWQGYTAGRPQPHAHQTHLETLVAGRYAASCRWVAAHAHMPALEGKAKQIISERATALKAFLKTGRLST